MNDPRSTFSSSALRYFDSTDHRSGPDLELIRRVASEVMPLVTVDVATGAGHALRAAAPYSAACIAADLTLEMLHAAYGHLCGAGISHVLYTQCRATALPMPAGSASLVLCRIAAHHFESIPRFLAEVRRVLATGGRFVVVDSLAPEDPEAAAFINAVERFRDPSHLCSLSSRKWRSLLARARLKIVEETSFLRTHPFMEWARRVGMKEGRIIELEDMFKGASESVRDQFEVCVDKSGRVQSYADEKGMWVCGRAE